MSSREKLFCGVIAGAGLLLLVLTFTCGFGRAATDVNKLSDLDRNILLRTDAQLQLLQKEAEPVVREQQDVLSRVCKAAKLTVGVDCIVDAKTSTVSKKSTAPPTPAPAKK